MKALLLRNPEELVQRWKRGRLQPLKGEPRELSQVPMDEAGIYKAAAAWLAVIAYPDDIPKRDRFIEGVVAWHYWRWRIEPPARYRWRSRDIENVFNSAHRRLSNRRLPAAEVVTLWELGQVAQGAIRITTHVNSITDAIRLAPEYGTSHRDYRNVRRLVWEESLPVLPLTLALRSHLLAKPDTGFEGLLVSPEWVRRALPHSWLQARLLSHHLSIDLSTFIMLTEKA